MGYGFTTRTFASVDSYESARNHFHNTPAIRGKSKRDYGVPLRRDRKYWDIYSVRERLTADAEAPAYSVRVYQTHVVTYYANGDIVLDTGGYATQTTASVMSEMLPIGVYVHKRNNHALLTYIDEDGARVTFPVETTLKLRASKRTPRGLEVDPDTAPRVAHPVLNREKAKIIREQLKPLFEYATTIAAMPLTAESVRAMRDSSDPWVRAVGVECRLVGYVNRDYEFNLDRFKRVQREAAYRRENAYDMVPLPLGEWHAEAELLRP